MSTADGSLNIRIKAEQKFSNFYSNIFDRSTPYELINESGEIVDFLPGTVTVGRHIVDMRSDPSFTNSDIILCTENQLTSEEAEVHLDNFNYFLNNNEDRFLGLAVYYREQIDLTREFDGNAFSIFKTCVDNTELTLLLLYRKNNTSVHEFYDLLRYLTSVYDIDLIVGDFNLKPNENLRNILNLYYQLIETPTFISGSILDQVYVKKSLLLRLI